MAAGHSTSHIYQSLFANLAIAFVKFGAAFLTNSGAMLAEAIHSAADTSNQLLLLLGVKRAAKPPDSTHPMGYGRALYFWSFMVAMLLFAGGGAFSVYEGIHKILHPTAIEHVWIGLGVLFFSLVLEGGATWSNVRALNRRRASMPFFDYLRATKDSDLVVVFGENAAASFGLLAAMGSMLLAWATGQALWDGVGSLVVGLTLVAVAVFLAVEVKSLLIGEAAGPEVEKAVREALKRHTSLGDPSAIVTLQQGPGEVMVAIKVSSSSQISSLQLASAIDAFESDLRSAAPEVKWCFVEPSVPLKPEGK